MELEMIRVEKEVVANRKDEPEEAAVQPCCRCSGWINSEAQIFDSETCSHVVCVECRFKEEKCVICANDAPANTSILEKNSDANLFCSETDFKYFKRKTFNTDHIVDVVEVDEMTAGCKQMCTVCQRVFKSSNARYHYACASGDKPYSCPVCARKFVKKSHLQVHVNNHYGIKPFKCTESKCNAAFTQKDKLARHMKTHNKERENFHTCPVCSKNYSSKDILKVHVTKVHSSDKTFQCDLCPRSYKYSKSLQIHRLKHLAKKLYMCETCGKKYTLAAQLKIHKRSHIAYQRRPHKCSCGCRFITRRDKLRHQLIHVTTSKDFECSLCNTTFGRKDNLERHMKNFHQENPPISSKGKKASTVNKSQTGRKNKEDKLNVVINSDKSGTVDKSSTKRKRNTKHKSTASTRNEDKVDFKEVVVDLSVNKSNITNCKKTVSDQTKSVVIPSCQFAVQNRPSVIKSVPKLSSYRIIPTVKAPRNIDIPNTVSVVGANNQSSNKSAVKPATKPATEPKPVRKPPVRKDSALDKCFRIIHHTSSLESRRQIINPSFEKANDNSNSVYTDSSLSRKKTTSCVTINSLENSVMRCFDNKRSMEGASLNSNQIPRKLLEASSSNFPGGPTLPSTLQENLDTSQEENLSNTYVPISETSDAAYTPYFESDSFRETVNNNYGEFDIGFQYENETFGYSETSTSGMTRVVKSVETKVIKHL